MEPTALLPSEIKSVVLRIFIALQNPSLCTGFEPANHGSNDENDNYHTTENDQPSDFLFHVVKTAFL
jgi:hypothetical protein